MVRGADPILSQIRQFTQHEGRDLRYDRLESEPAERGPSRIQALIEVPIAEVPQMVGERFEEKLMDIAADLARQQAQLFFESVARDSKEVGTAYDAAGRPLSGGMLLDIIGQVQEEFDERGRSQSQFVIHPDMSPALRRAGEEIENDPALKKRQEEILKRKREEWLARESNRRLVD
jgi:hypothetical protein